MRIKYLLAAAVLAGATALATPAAASEPITCNPGSLSLFSPAATSCVGYYDGNVFSNSSADVTTQTNALNALGLTFTNFNDYTKIALTGGVSTQMDFGTALTGVTVIGIHWGNIPDNTAPNGGNVSAFLVFNFATPTDVISILNNQGISDAVLYETGQTPGVPEPATWGMMILGFGAAGIAIRRSRRKTALVSQLA
jgi:hypothetical protein